MRKITEEATHAFLNHKSFRKGNTEVKVSQHDVILYLHGNIIAINVLFSFDLSEIGLWVTNAGWFSNTTKERLNGHPNLNIYQKKKKWYLNGEEWDGSWKKIY